MGLRPWQACTQAATETPTSKTETRLSSKRAATSPNISIATLPRVSHLIFDPNTTILCTDRISIYDHRKAAMAPKVPSDKALERALEDAVQSIFDSDERADLTVNYVRQVAEKKLGLEDGFFKS